MPSQTLSIAGLTFLLELPCALPPDPAFQPFLGSAEDGFTVTFEPVEALPPIPGQSVYQDLFHTVFPCEDSYLYVHYLDGKPFAVTTWDKPTGRVRVRYLREKETHVRSFHDCIVCIPFWDLLMSRDRLILHASFISMAYGGILFSGPSGIGKSTQARLWETLEGSKLINGDRPILSRSPDGWFAHGSPYAGSSQCYVNERRPIAAIVMLEQGSACSIRPMGQAEAFRRLYAETVISAWNNDYVQRACDLLTDLSASVPVYQLCCTPDARAVETLKAELNKRGR